MNTIAIIAIIISLAGIGIIIFRKFPQLSIIKVETVRSEREAKIKTDILLKRLKRVRSEWILKLLNLFSPVGRWIKRKAGMARKKVVELEREHVETIKPQEPENLSLKIENLIFEAKELMEEGNYREAEQKFLFAISLDYKNIYSYEGLGELYLKKKEYKEAKETFEFILKLDPSRPDIYFDLARATLGLGETNKTMEHLNKALEFAPNNPKYLDFLVEVSIINNNYKLARNALEKLKDVNPENQKITEFEERIRQMR